MAESDGLGQAYNIPAVTGVRPGYVFAKNRHQKRQEKKKHEPPEEAGHEPDEEAKKHVDIKV
jgi:hypothetical protein